MLWTALSITEAVLWPPPWLNRRPLPADPPSDLLTSRPQERPPTPLQVEEDQCLPVAEATPRPEITSAGAFILKFRGVILSFPPLHWYGYGASDCCQGGKCRFFMAVDLGGLVWSAGRTMKDEPVNPKELSSVNPKTPHIGRAFMLLCLLPWIST